MLTNQENVENSTVIIVTKNNLNDQNMRARYDNFVKETTFFKLPHMQFNINNNSNNLDS